MAVNYTTAVKTSRMTATRDDVANGSLEILDTDGTTVLVTYGLDATAGSVSGARWTLGFDATTVAASASGTAATARIKDSGGTAQITGLTVGTSGADITIDNTSINSGQDCTINSAYIDHA